jgi:hypothetical protein
VYWVSVAELQAFWNGKVLAIWPIPKAKPKRTWLGRFSWGGA